MKLHLPKGLFIAVLAAISSILSTTFGADTISVNFTGSENKKVTASSSGSLGDVDYTGWNNIACSVGTSTLKDNNGDDQAATLVLGYDKGNTDKGGMGSYRSATNSNGTVTGDVQRGYIDVWNTGENHYTISLTHDYWLYDAIFYMSGDTAGATFAPMEVNGTAYIGGTDVLATDANKAWGSGYTTGCKEYTDNNRVTVTSQIGHTLLATNVWTVSSSRATLAGLQVVDRTAETVYFTTLGSGETTTADASWSLNGAAATPYADISAEAKYLGVVADAAGSTLKVDAGDSIKFLGVKENALTVVSDGSVSVERIITDANTSLNIAAGLTGTRMDIYGDGTLTISGDASAFSGALYVHGGELIIKNDTTKFGLGSAIINDGSLALRSDLILHTDKNKLVTQLRDSSGNVVNGFAGDGYTLNRLIATGTGSVALQEGSKVYYGTGDTTGSTLIADSNSIFALDSAESGVYYVSSGQSVNIGSVSLAEGQTLDKFSVFGTLNINSTTLPGGKTLRQLLTTTVGTGTIELSQSANLQNGDEMAFEGKLVIKSGADLRIGIAGTDGWGYSAQGINLLKLDSIELAGGTLSTRFYSGNLGDILVSSNSTLHAVDITATNNVKEQMSIGTLSINEGATLTLKAGWKANIAVSQLTGQGSVFFTVVDADSLMRDVVVQSVKGFTGNFSIENHSGNKANVTFTVKDGESLNASQIAASNHSSIVIDGAGTYNMGNQLLIAKWGTAERGSLADTWTGKVAFSGAAFNNTNLNNYGNAGSTISIHKSSGSVADGTILSDIELVETSGASAFDLQTTKAVNLVFAGDISGKGNFGYVKNSGHNVSFTGDVEKWTGVLWASADSTITYSGNAKVISNEITAGKGNTEFGAKSTVKFVNSSGMTVKSNINSNTYTNGTLNLVVSNDANAANPTGVVEFAEGTIGSKGTTNLTVETGAAAKFSNSAVQFNDILVEAQAQLSFTGKEALSVSKLEMQQGAAVSVGTIEKPQGTLTVTKEAVFNGGQVQANLTLGSGAKVTMGSALTMGTTTATASETGSSASTGYTLSLEKGLTLKLTGDMLSKFNALTPDSGELVLFTGVNTLVLGTGDDQVVYHVGQELAKDNGVKLSDYIKVEGAYACNEYYIGFRDGNVFAGMIVPEPTTATLSLLALAGLCARRRRK